MENVGTKNFPVILYTILQTESGVHTIKMRFSAHSDTRITVGKYFAAIFE